MTKAKKAQRPVFWIGSFDYNGYPLHVVSETEQGALDALYCEYRKHEQKADYYPDVTTREQFREFFGPWLQEAELDKVVWP